MVVDKISRRYIGFGGVEPLVVAILRVFGLRVEVIWVTLSAIGTATA